MSQLIVRKFLGKFANRFGLERHLSTAGHSAASAAFNPVPVSALNVPVLFSIFRRAIFEFCVTEYRRDETIRKRLPEAVGSTRNISPLAADRGAVTAVQDNLKAVSAQVRANAGNMNVFLDQYSVIADMLADIQEEVRKPPPPPPEPRRKARSARSKLQ
jgi:hypothetical protein